MKIVSAQSLAGGTGKTRFCKELALEAKRLGLRVLAIDTCHPSTLFEMLTAKGFFYLGHTGQFFSPDAPKRGNVIPMPHHVVLGRPGSPIDRVDGEVYDRKLIPDPGIALSHARYFLARHAHLFDYCIIDCYKGDPLLNEIVARLSDDVHYFQRRVPASPFQYWKKKVWSRLPATEQPRIILEEDRLFWPSNQSAKKGQLAATLAGLAALASRKRDAGQDST